MLNSAGKWSTTGGFSTKKCWSNCNPNLAATDDEKRPWMAVLGIFRQRMGLLVADAIEEVGFGQESIPNPEWKHVKTMQGMLL